MSPVPIVSRYSRTGLSLLPFTIINVMTTRGCYLHIRPFQLRGFLNSMFTSCPALTRCPVLYRTSRFHRPTNSRPLFNTVNIRIAGSAAGSSPSVMFSNQQNPLVKGMKPRAGKRQHDLNASNNLFK
jgi:hypothetical protein